MTKTPTDIRFMYHRPDQKAINKMTHVRNKCGDLASYIDDLEIDENAKQQAINNLQMVSAWVNAGLAWETSNAPQITPPAVKNPPASK